MSYSCATRTASDLQPEFFPVQVQKGEVKLRASTSIPRSSIILTARVESSPPERRAIAFRFIYRAPEAEITFHDIQSEDIYQVKVFKRAPASCNWKALERMVHYPLFQAI